MSKFLPIENIVYKTRLNKDEIVKKLTKIVEPEKIFRFWLFDNPEKPYEGSISIDRYGFSIRRIRTNRNSFLPTIKGTFEKDNDGVIIKVKMGPHFFTFIILNICLPFASLMMYFALSPKALPFHISLLIAFGVSLFAYLLTMRDFQYESEQTKNDLQRCFQEDIIEN